MTRIYEAGVNAHSHREDRGTMGECDPTQLRALDLVLVLDLVLCQHSVHRHILLNIFTTDVSIRITTDRLHRYCPNANR